MEINDKLEKFGLKVDVLPIDSLKFYEKNNKRHGQKDLAAIYASIKAFGFTDVVICSKDLEIIAGHGRVMAAKKAGIGEVPVLIADQLTPNQVKAYRISHNRTANIAKYDDDIMVEELSALKDEGFPLDDLTPLKLDKWTNVFEAPEFDLDTYEPPTREEWTAVPDCEFPTDNDYGIPLLSPKLQAEYVCEPVMCWGDISQTQKFHGTWVFYTYDTKFEKFINDPTGPIRSDAVMCVEPNFSCTDNMPLAIAIYRTYWKRWIARFWQSKGLYIFVDMNTCPKYAELNLMGVPSGWRSYCTRGYNDEVDFIKLSYDLACKRRGSDDIIFWVYGGGKKVVDLCRANGWQHMPEARVPGRKEKLFGGENK